MADTEELRRLVLHAASLLNCIDPVVNATRIKDTAAWNQAIAQVAAIATAKSVLRMVAACMAVEDDAKEAPDGGE